MLFITPFCAIDYCLYYCAILMPFIDVYYTIIDIIDALLILLLWYWYIVIDIIILLHIILHALLLKVTMSRCFACDTRFVIRFRLPADTITAGRSWSLLALASQALLLIGFSFCFICCWYCIVCFAAFFFFFRQPFSGCRFQIWFRLFGFSSEGHVYFSAA